MTTESIPAALFSELKSKIEQKKARVAVIGLGYVGLPLALLYTEEKFAVTGFDIDARKVSTLDQGGSYIYRIPATEIQAAKKQGFNATSEYSRLTEMDAIIICVPTPLNEYHEPDLSFITDTAKSIAPAFAPRASGYFREHNLSWNDRRSVDPDFGERQPPGAQGFARGWGRWPGVLRCLLA